MGVYYYYPFSKNAAKYVLEHSFDTGLYKDKTFKWHYYFMSRVSVCPVVLTENGYYSNDYDYRIIKDNKANAKKAKALAYGVVEYFASIQ
jgi:N-acetylmuramoyl-L-alanine amidase